MRSEKEKVRKKLWRLEHPEKMKEYKRKYYEKYKEKVKARSRARYQSMTIEQRKHYARSHSLKVQYGLSVETYNQMLEVQGHACFLCKRSAKKVPLHIDHDHKTGKVRKLLCVRCNTTLGYLETHIEWMDRAKEYLNLHREEVAA